MNPLRTTLQLVAALVVVLLGALTAFAIVRSREAPPTSAPEIKPPLVRAETLEARDLPLVVRAQGTVVPRTATTLAAEVSGRIVAVSPRLAEGAFFEEGTVLARIDPADYRQAVASAGSRVAQAELRLAQEEASAKVARREWDELGGGEEASPLTLRELQVEEARASLEAARAELERAERDLARTAISAPFAGRVRTKNVDIGQFVARGAAIAGIYGVDVAEVRLPLPDTDLAFFEVPLGYRGERRLLEGAPVTISATFAGRRHEWRGRLVRTEGEIDPRSRVVTVVAAVDDPYARREGVPRPPLSVGMFVDAAIQGRVAEGVFVVPRSAFLDEDTVLVIDEEERLRFRDVEVLKSQRESIVVSAGLEQGERVLVSALDVVTEGMRVRVEGEERGGGEERADDDDAPVNVEDAS